MSAKTLTILQHEARWALRFLFGPVSTKEGVPELRKRLETALGDKDKFTLELSEDELKLCVEGYDGQTSTRWIEGVKVGEAVIPDERSPFTEDETELYCRMKNALLSSE